MNSKVLPPLGVPAAVPSPAPLTFPADLIYPAQSQVARSGDAVTDRIARLDTWAQQLGAGFGMSLTNFELNPLQPPVDNSGWSIGMHALASALIRAERISLERRSGRWGLYFTREAAIIGQERRGESMLLKDAPLDVRERFLVKSEEFFRAYLKLCEERLGRMRVAVAQADRTLELLNGLQLE